MASFLARFIHLMRRPVAPGVDNTWHANPFVQDVDNPSSLEALHLQTIEANFFAPAKDASARFSREPVHRARTVVLRDDVGPFPTTELGRGSLVLDIVVGATQPKDMFRGVPVFRYANELG